MNLFAVLVGLLAIGWWLMWRKSGGGLQALSVTGGTVAIDNSDSVEERRVWRYVGETTKLVTVMGRGAQAGFELSLVQGAIYDVIPVTRIQGEPLAPTKDRPLGLIEILLVGYPNGITRGRWVTSWEPVILTVQEQLAGSLRIVPNAFRPDDTETL